MRIWIQIFAVSVISALLLSACNNQEQNAESPDQQIRSQETAPQQEILDNVSLASHLKSIAESVPDVNQANVVVVGQTAIVGIDVDSNLERSKVGTLKYSVAEALRKDPYGAGAIVTADMDINARLKEIATDIQNGQPVSGFLNELSDIVGRIMPQVPADLMPREEQPPNTSEEKSELNHESL